MLARASQPEWPCARSPCTPSSTFRGLVFTTMLLLVRDRHHNHQNGSTHHRDHQSERQSSSEWQLSSSWSSSERQSSSEWQWSSSRSSVRRPGHLRVDVLEAAGDHVAGHREEARREHGLNSKQGNYSLRRPPKLIIPQAVIRHWEKMSICMHIDV